MDEIQIFFSLMFPILFQFDMYNSEYTIVDAHTELMEYQHVVIFIRHRAHCDHKGPLKSNNLILEAGMALKLIFLESTYSFEMVS